MHILENEALRVKVADKGAELCSVTDKASGRERIWTADPSVWNRHAPILFPFVGKVTGGKYRIGDREYPMKTQHGFARDMDFECVEKSGAVLRQRLASTEETKAVYPYDFSLEVIHSLDPGDPRRLDVGWKVKNTGNGTMHFSIGGHPGFLLPPDTAKEDCYLVFRGHESLVYFSVTRDGYALPDIKHRLDLNHGYAAYQADIPDTWIFDGQRVTEVGIALPDRTPYVTLRCEQFPMLAVWANPNGRFICLEPWFGRTDNDGFSGTLSEKPGMETLGPGEAKEISYQILF